MVSVSHWRIWVPSKVTGGGDKLNDHSGFMQEFLVRWARQISHWEKDWTLENSHFLGHKSTTTISSFTVHRFEFQTHLVHVAIVPATNRAWTHRVVCHRSIRSAGSNHRCRVLTLPATKSHSETAAKKTDVLTQWLIASSQLPQVKSSFLMVLTFNVDLQEILTGDLFPPDLDF